MEGCRSAGCVCVCLRWFCFGQSIPHLHPVSHLYKCTGGVEGPSSTGVQVGAVIVVHDLHVVHAVGLKDTHGYTQCQFTHE